MDTFFPFPFRFDGTKSVLKYLDKKRNVPRFSQRSDRGSHFSSMKIGKEDRVECTHLFRFRGGETSFRIVRIESLNEGRPVTASLPTRFNVNSAIKKYAS